MAAWRRPPAETIVGKAAEADSRGARFVLD